MFVIVFCRGFSESPARCYFCSKLMYAVCSKTFTCISNTIQLYYLKVMLLYNLSIHKKHLPNGLIHLFKTYLQFHLLIKKNSSFGIFQVPLTYVRLVPPNRGRLLAITEAIVRQRSRSRAASSSSARVIPVAFLSLSSLPAHP